MKVYVIYSLIHPGIEFATTNEEKAKEYCEENRAFNGLILYNYRTFEFDKIK